MKRYVLPTLFVVVFIAAFAWIIVVGNTEWKYEDGNQFLRTPVWKRLK